MASCTALAFGVPLPSGAITARATSNPGYVFSWALNASVSYAHDGLNRMQYAGGTAMGYDARGNLTSSGPTVYGYDVENHLTSSSSGVGLSYDPLGRLYEVSVPWLTSERFQYDGDEVVAEYGPTGQVVRRYARGPGVDEPLIWYEGSSNTDRRWLSADERGSVIAVTNGLGQPMAFNTYDEYGIPAGGDVGRFQYTGQMWIGPLGLYHDKARAYSPTLGRFMQTDPIGYAADRNLYAYVGNDPINDSDPTGLDPALDPPTPASVCPDCVSPVEVTGRKKQPQPGGITYISIPGATPPPPPFRKTNVIPRNASRCTSGNVSFYAPPSFNPGEIQNTGAGEGPVNGLLDAGRAVGQGGAFDFQRMPNSSGGTVFFSAYTNASNFAVGLYLRGAGYGKTGSSLISNGYAAFKSKNYGSSDQNTFRDAGIDAANGANVSCFPAF